MKKVYMLIGVLSVFLASCGGTSQENAEGNMTSENATIQTTSIDEPTESETTEPVVESAENQTFDIEITNAQVIKSPMERTEGIYIEFNMTNLTDENIVPFEMREYIALAQETDTSYIYLEPTYYETDAFGEDKYDEMVDKHNDLSNELLPGKTVEVHQSYYLEDKDLPIEVIIYDPVSGMESETFMLESLE